MSQGNDYPGLPGFDPKRGTPNYRKRHIFDSNDPETTPATDAIAGIFFWCVVLFGGLWLLAWLFGVPTK